MFKLFIGLIKFALFLIVMPFVSVLAVLYNFLPIVCSGGNVKANISFSEESAKQ